ncbi:MAG: hypothetical protein ACYCZF_06550 [Anaerolineae bacterium]
MAKKGHSAASRRQAASRAAMNNVQRPTAVEREPRQERTQSESVGAPAPKRVAPRTDVGRMSRVVAAPSAKPPEASIQYPYVLSDLKQLAITAAAMFAVLIVLSLVIR